MFVTRLYCLLLVFSLISGAHAAPLPPSVLAALKQAHIPLADIGVEVREANTRKPLISVNGAQPMNPASTMKLLTTYAGLELLGPAYTWKTEAWIDGKLESGILQGDLVLKGYGDPKLTIEQFWLWLRELRGRGLREIHGNVIVDRGAFHSPHMIRQYSTMTRFAPTTSVPMLCCSTSTPFICTLFRMVRRSASSLNPSWLASCGKSL